MKELISGKEYRQFFTLVSHHIKSSQAKAAIAVNTAMILLYWNLGKLIADKQVENSWGNGVIDQLAKDLKTEYPTLSGFSRANLFFIRKFYIFYSTAKVQQAVRLLAVPVKKAAKVQQPVRLLAETSKKSAKVQQAVGLLQGRKQKREA